MKERWANVYINGRVLQSVFWESMENLKVYVFEKNNEKINNNNNKITMEMITKMWSNRGWN